MKGESIAKLTTVLHMKAGSQSLELIAREGAWIRLNPHLNTTSGFIFQALLMILPML